VAGANAVVAAVDRSAVLAASRNFIVVVVCVWGEYVYDRGEGIDYDDGGILIVRRCEL